MTGVLQPSPEGRRRVPRWGWTSSIRTRVLAIVLIPSIALLITGASVAGSLVSQGLSARTFAKGFTQNSNTLVQVLTAIDQERTVSLQALAGDPDAVSHLQAQWKMTDAALSQGNTAAAQSPGQLAAVRQDVLTGRESLSEADTFYTSFMSAASSGALQAARSAPNSVSGVDLVTPVLLLSVPTTHSRVVGLGAGWLASGVVSPPEQLILGQLAGSYRNQLQALAAQVPQSLQATYQRLTAGSAWRIAASGEDQLGSVGTLTISRATWLAAENTVSAALFQLWVDDLGAADTAAANAASNALSTSILVGSLVLVVAIAALIASIFLANGLVRRLRKLRSRTLEMADVTLPSMVRRIGDGEPVDVETEMAKLDYGSDEIGQVAEAFNNAQRAAVAAATAEARTRTGVSKVFLDIAHRSQLVVHRQLELLDVAEGMQSDPVHLELLFKLDHLATRARRNAENLLILGGGQPGRKWRKPAALEDIVRSAVSETEQFARVSTVRLPDVQVAGGVVGDLIHLLAELVDNAAAFSPPDAPVTVRGNVVGKGVVVEVDDQGLGIEFAERERFNEMLRHPPDFQAMARSGQRHLGLFVVGQLAQRHGITVSLLESAYGGIKAIVLIPSNVTEADGAAGGDAPAMSRPGRHELPQQGPAETAPLPMPEARGSDGHGSEGRGSEGEGWRAWWSTEPASPPLSRPGAQAPGVSLLLLGTGPYPGPRSDGLHPDGLHPARGARAPLPRRERLASLAPGLRPDAPAAASSRPRRLRSPEEARSSMSAFQRGTRLGRDDPGQDNQ